jgi:type IV pilus assembly protein PilM
VAFIDAGARTSHVVVTVGDVPQFVRIIAAGGHNLTAALADRLGMDFAQARTVKATLGLTAEPTNAQEAQAIEIIREVTGELLSSFRNTLNYFANTHSHLGFDEIVVSGNAAKLPGFPDALAEITRIPVTMANPFASVDISRELKRTGMPEPGSMAVALGLALGSAA